ncbi:peptidoglycan editing factor PgeF [Ottowia testudinis]|uniref:Purine nucleoside phosphorylase n=1 Tax=Ottowia testudinis TaxID=2816950 RepID=A0A975CCV0_9BURK|nr:peptidoglycan editing factor PgeF [Ottowia testudinis]QTD44045.1 peptidoglycan editing factor PgeF [Ottowia testudinis]
MPSLGPALLVPDWPAPPHVRARFTTRGASAADGASAPPCEFFNLGDHVGDAPAAVQANRQRLQQVLGARPVFMRQVHGVDVLALMPGTPDGMTADAAVTTQRGLACAVMVADCLPVLLTDTAGRAVAAAHAGWRGLASGVLEQTLKAFRAVALTHQAQAAIDTEAIQVMAWLGPCIGPQVFEVGAEVRQAFLDADAGAAACFAARPGGKFLADLPALARRRLAAAGVTRVHGNDGSPGWCTVQQPQRYFSYRRDQSKRGGTGRMAACIWLA